MKQTPLSMNTGTTALVMIEFQREWIDPGGKLQTVVEDKAQFESAIEGGRELLHIARTANIAIAHVGLRFQEGYPELGSNGFGLRSAIRQFGTFRAATSASDFADGFEPREGEFVVSGRTGGSAFAGSNLDIWLRNNQLSSVVFCGFALHVCVESSLRAAHDLGYETFLAHDATAAFTGDQQRHVLDHVVHHFARSISNADLRQALVPAKETIA